MGFGGGERGAMDGNVGEEEKRPLMELTASPKQMTDLRHPQRQLSSAP